MRRFYGAAAAAILTVLGCTAAFAAESAYLGVGGGVSIVPDHTLNNGVNIGMDPGWAAAGTLGLRFHESAWRLELEGAHRENDAGVTGADGKIKSSSIMVNALRDLDMGWKIIPYVGAGIGVARLNLDLPVANSDKRGDGYIWQVIGGATMPICDKLDLFLDYRYYETWAADVGLAGSELDDGLHGHEVMAGLRWTFWRAPAPVAAAAPAPAPVVQPKDYVIYFEFDKANVTKAAGAVLDELKASSNGASASVVGHTDTTGSVAYNQKLSERRAKNTASALTQRGVTVGPVSGKGFSEPAVQTGPGVKEPLNRRAVVTLNGAAATQ